MQKFLIGIIFFMLLFLAGTGSHAQVFSDDIRSMHQFYQQQKVFKAEVKVEIFSGLDTKNPYIIKNASLKKNGSRFFYKIDQTEMLLTEKELIMVNNQDKILMYRKLSKVEYEEIQKEYYTQQLDSLTQHMDSVKYEGIRGGKKYYTISNAKRLIQRAEVGLDEKNNSLKEITYFYHPKLMKNINRVEIHFLNTDEVPVFTAEMFSEDRFVVKTGKKILPAPKYSKYQLNIVDYEN